MKTLYIVRHAKAVSRERPVPDIERPLSERGRRDAQAMADYTHAHGPIPEVLISSPALRAFETAQAFAQVYQYPVARIRTYTSLYNGTEPHTLLHLVQRLDDAVCTAMVIGHHPLCSDRVPDLAPTFRHAMPAGSVVCLQFQVSSWTEVASGRGVAVWFHDPKHNPSSPLPDHALQTPTALTFEPAAAFDASHFARDLQALYDIRTDAKTNRQVTYFDTFDWRLYNQSLTLQWEAPHLRLHALPDDHQHSCEALLSLPPAPILAPDLPPGALLQRLEPVIGIRALLPLFECTSQYDTWCLLNSDDKTVVRLVIERHTCANAQGSAPPLTRVCLKPLKGYAQEAEHVQQWLLARGFIPSHTPLYALALAALDVTPNHYNAKPQFQLPPDMPAHAAMRSILRFLFGVMRQNEAGILNDLDTEFLHDFRVASRRARSAVGQIKGVLDKSTTLRLKQDLASLGVMTNRVRDLDVYLLQQADYRAKLPADAQDAIEPLFDLLKRDRKQAMHGLKRKLRSNAYAELMTRWETFLNADAAEPTAKTAPNASRPIRKIAQKRLSKLSDRVVQTGHLLLTCEDDKRFHELRIDCKKLRYVLEFTSSLFPQPAVAPVIKHLRKLQDVLGDFHDCCVQQETLKTYAEQFDAHAAETQATHQAIRQLIDVLEREKQACKAAFAKRFQTFAASVEDGKQPWKPAKGKATKSILSPPRWTFS
ncbi:CHAD domain-containing protein [Candidatus Entotheonella palauensis]|uniref:CHAD domain-containing protein n=1 Tax=Candidatus Entotheonella palauensis TaxID=93172 RepID=UPI0015C4D832|nr:CHAD domain-containing protein [Candidatus Entotheonella palauensis]